jgi:exodeoxyribonuclease-3
MKVSTWNVNGIRAREAQVLEWLEKEAPEVLCLQEIKASPEDVPPALVALDRYWHYWHGHKGYSGVALFLKKSAFPNPPAFFHPTFDLENRIVAVKVGDLLFASVYVPNGNKDYEAKKKFVAAMDAYVAQVLAEGTRLILCGDMNIARLEVDVHPKLRKSEQIGQRPEEKAQFEQILSHGLVDLSRKFEPDNDQLFSWWAPWRNQRERNIGWRLDYVLCPPSLAEAATRCTIHREFGLSDHGPVVADFDVVIPVEKATPPSEVAAGNTTPKAPAEGQLPLPGFETE